MVISNVWVGRCLPVRLCGGCGEKGRLVIARVVLAFDADGRLNTADDGALANGGSCSVNCACTVSRVEWRGGG